MAKLEHFYLNLENFCMLLMMLIIMGALQSMLHQTDKELFQEEPKAKFESGKSQNKPKLCRLLLKNIEVEFGQ